MPKGVWGPKKVEYDLLPLMQEFIDEKEHPTSRQTYRTALGRLSIYLRSVGVTDPRKITKEIVEGYPEYIWSLPDLKQSTRESNMYMVRSWMEWLKKMGVLVYNPWGDKDFPMFGWIKISIPKTPELSPRELGLVFELHRQRRSQIAPFWWHREAVILAAIYGWGLGPSEIVEMTTGQVHPQLDYVTVRNRLSPVRDLKSIPYGEEMKSIMRRWLNVRLPREKPGIENLIIDITGDPIQPESIMKHMTKLGNQAGVHLTTSRLRETGIQEFLRSSVTIEEIAAMLGVSRETALLHIKHDESPYSKESKDLINRMTKRLRVRYEQNGNKYWRHPDAIEDEEAEGI